MGKIILVITIGILIFSKLYAQSAIDIWEVADETYKITTGFNAFSRSVCYDTLDAPRIYDDNKNQYVKHWDRDVIRIDFTNTLSPNQNSLLHFPIIVWENKHDNKFVYDLQENIQEHDTIYGYSIDFSDPANRYVQCKVQTNSDVKLGVILTDIQGKQSNGAIPIVSVNSTAGGANIADDAKWQTILFNWSSDATATANVPYLIDTASTEWWGRSNVGYRNAIEELDSSKIVMLSFIIDPYDFGNLNDEKRVFIKDIKIGNNYMEFYPHCLDEIFSTLINTSKIRISFQENNLTIENQKVIAIITIIDVNGKQLLSKQIQPQESISIESLPQGVYIIQVISESGNAQMKLVKK